ncbi:MAG: hypothetical protein AAGG38_06830 [Planctomycetota bacterium]
MKRKLRLSGDRMASFMLPQGVVGPRLGVKYVFYRVTLLDNNASGSPSEVSGLTQFAVMEPVGVTPGVQTGEFILANTGPDVRPDIGAEEQEKVVRAAAIVGAEVLRIDVPWRFLEPRAGEKKWDSMDRAYSLLEQYGVDPQLLIAYGGADWTKSDATLARMRADGIDLEHWPAPTYPPRPDLWGQWSREVAERYGNRTELYEVWNEPDIPFFFQGTPQEYVDLLKSGSRAIRSADGDAVVMTAGFVGPDHPATDPRFIVETLEQARSSFDWFAYHRHGTFAMLQRDVEELLTPMIDDALDERPPLYFSETSMGREPEREYEMAIELPKRVAYLWSIGATGWTAFSIHQKHPDSNGYHYTMLFADYTPRPVWVAYNEMARQMRGRRFVETLDVGPGRFGYAFRGKGDFSGEDDRSWLWLAWTEDPATADQAVPIRVGEGATVERIDLMGNRTPIAVHDGVAVMPIEREPAYVVAENVRGEAELLEPLLEPTGLGLTLVPGGSAEELALTLRNPLDRSLTYALSATAADPLSPSIEPSSVVLPGGGEATVFLRCGLPREGSEHDRVEVTAVSDLLSGRVSVPILLARTSPGGSFVDMARRLPDYHLNRSEQVVNTKSIDPGSAHLTWGGPTDVSVAAWVGREDDALLLRFNVLDDTHRQPYAGRDLWKGDAVQVGLAVPGQAGHLEFGVALTDSGEAASHVWVAPPGGSGEQIETTIEVEAERLRAGMTYRVKVPLAAFGASADVLDRGVLLSFVAQDLDEDTPGAVREGFIQLSEGITGDKNPLIFPLIVFEND